MSAPIKYFGQRPGVEEGRDPFAGLWRIRVEERIYGPYTGYQMRTFLEQGRLAAHSMVARESGGGVETQWHGASVDSVLGSLFRPTEQATPAFGQKAEPGASKFVLIIDVKGRTLAPLENAIISLGRAYRIGEHVWLLSGAHTVTGLRNHLSQHLGPQDWMLVIDAKHARTAGYNMGPENDAHIRHVWRDTEEGL